MLFNAEPGDGGDCAVDVGGVGNIEAVPAFGYPVLEGFDAVEVCGGEEDVVPGVINAVGGRGGDGYVVVGEGDVWSRLCAGGEGDGVARWEGCECVEE